MDLGLGTLSIVRATTDWVTLWLSNLKVKQTQGLFCFFYFSWVLFRISLKHCASTLTLRRKLTAFFKVLLFNFLGRNRGFCQRRLIPSQRPCFGMCWILSAVTFLLIKEAKLLFSILILESTWHPYLVLNFSRWRPWTLLIFGTFKINTFIFRLLWVFLVFF